MRITPPVLCNANNEPDIEIRFIDAVVTRCASCLMGMESCYRLFIRDLEIDLCDECVEVLFGAAHDAGCERTVTGRCTCGEERLDRWPGPDFKGVEAQ